MNPKHLIPTLLVLFGLLTATSVFAQADRIGNGGNWSEADLKHCLERLANYLSSTEGQMTFPEIREYDEKHPNETVEKIARNLNVRLQNHAVFDSKGNERDCVSHAGQVRYFECNVGSLPAKPQEDVKVEAKSEYYGSLYRIVLHEVLVQAELEKPLSKEVPSEYTISSRLMVHLENFPEWVPGAPDSEIPVRTVEVYHSKPEWSVSVGGGPSHESSGPYSNTHGVASIDLNLQFPVNVGNERLKFGFSTGFMKSFGSSSSWSIPLLVTTEYDFHPIGTLRPYVRMGIGLTVSHHNYTYTDDGLDGVSAPYTYSGSETTAGAMLKLSIGASFGTQEQYYIEIQPTVTTYFDPMLLLHFGYRF